ncbi:MAG: phosphoribosyltransferase family protein [Nonlabens sp.]
MIRHLKRTFNDLVQLFYPEVCLGCRTSLYEGEKLLCLTCFSQLPVAYKVLEADDKVKDLFYGRANIEHASSLLFYEKIGMVKQLIHHLKYDGHEEVSSYLGKQMANAMYSDPAFQKLTHVVPVPVHKKRLKKRGYNQVNGFGMEIASKFEAKFMPDLLIKTRNTINQAKLGQVKRSDESSSPYELNLNLELPENSHILIVDDVITTGTTLSMCIKELQKIKGTTIYVATMAISV